MKKTKIIATIGPASFDKNILQEMMVNLKYTNNF